MVLQSTKLSFSNLIKDVIDKGLCVKCGACVSSCADYKYGAIELCDVEDNLPRYVDQNKCVQCGICYLRCPQNYDLNKEIKREFCWSYPIGRYNNIFSAQTTDEEIKKVSAFGGVGSALSLYLLENKIVDGVIVSKRTGLFDCNADIIIDREGVMQSVDFPFFESNHSIDKNIKHSNFVSILPLLRLLGPAQSTKLAAVGTPCQISALRKMKILDLSPADNIHCSIGLFCMQCLTFDNLMEKTFVKKYQINPADITEINFREDFKLNMRSGRTILIPSEDIADIIRPSCLVCQDFANDFADISIGGAGSPDGFTTTLIRTEIGKRVFNDAVKQGYIKCVDLNKGDSDKIVSHIETFVEKKRVRTEKTKVDNLYIKWNALNRHLNWVMGFVNHELNSMLGSVVMNISALADAAIAEKLGKKKSNKMMLEALVTLKRMEDMIRNFLVSSKLNSGHLAVVPTKINIGTDVTGPIIESLKPRLEVKGMSFVCERCDQIEVVGDKTLIQIAISNLMHNAVKYGSENTAIYGSVIKFENGFEYRITNEGIGIPEDKLESIFQEYTRYDTLGVGGTGLGLYLVKRIADIHHGSIKSEAGFIIDDKFLNYEALGNRPELEYGDKELRKFATFILRIPLIHEPNIDFSQRDKKTQ